MIKINESQLKQIVSESIKKLLKEEIEESFSEMENWVFNQSRPYNDSSAFRKALQFVSENNKDLYMELIKEEFFEGNF